MNRPIKTKERETILRALKSGVVPHIGLQHIHVGRTDELKSVVHDIDAVADGGAMFRLVIGEYGSGKTFFLSLIRSIALEKGLVTFNADLAPTKRLYGSDLHVRALLSDLVSSCSTRSKLDGNALENILENFFSIARDTAKKSEEDLADVIYKMLLELRSIPNGYDFGAVINAYWKGHESGEEELQNHALSWLKAEYSTKTDAYRDLKIRSYLNYTSFFTTMQLYSILIRKAGYKGLIVCLDEMVNLYKLTNGPTRNSNYELILNILNSTLQGSLSGIGFIMSGTPEFLTDRYRGLYSYEALRSRLAENTFSANLGLKDYTSTVLRLSNLTKEEVYVLLKNIRNVFASGNQANYLVPDEALVAFLKYCSDKIGDSYFRTPRTTIKSFVDLLSLLEQYPDKKWTDILEQINIVRDIEPSYLQIDASEATTSSEEEEFSTFKL
jgi:hypothetical protein